MPSPFIGGRIPQDLHDHLKSHMEQTGEKLADILKAALATYLDHPIETSVTPTERIVDERFTALENRIAILETSMSRVANQTTKLLERPSSAFEIHPDQLSLLDAPTNSEQASNQLNDQQQAKTDATATASNSEEIEEHRTDSQEPELPTVGLKQITVQEMSRRTGIKLSTLAVYRSRGKEVVKGGFKFKPLGKRGEAMWLVEKTSS